MQSEYVTRNDSTPLAKSLFKFLLLFCFFSGFKQIFSSSGEDDGFCQHPLFPSLKIAVKKVYILKYTSVSICTVYNKAHVAGIEFYFGHITSQQRVHTSVRTKLWWPMFMLFHLWLSLKAGSQGIFPKYWELKPT